MKLYGNYRAQVVDSKDPEKHGRVKIFVPDLMPTLDQSKDGIWARPANNPVGGRNSQSGLEDHYFMGSSYIPQKGSWVFIFFEMGNINRPYYFSSLDLENEMVLPENQVGTDYYKKWTIFKSHEGRCIIVSDDSDDKRVEITGKKRKLSNSPTGDIDSVYTIDGNQTTILFDERDGKEKILIRTHKGDFFHIDVDDQKLQGYFKEGINLKTDGDFLVKAKNIKFLADSKIGIQSNDSIIIKSTSKLNLGSDSNMNLKCGATINLDSSAAMNMLAGGIVNIMGSGVALMGPASPAELAEPVDIEEPKGERDT